MNRATATRTKPVRLVVLALAIGTLAGCEEGKNMSLFKSKDQPATEAPANEGEVVERDVEAPEIFSANEAGLWDGRPSLGGIWVAHPDVKDPERVKITNQSNGKVITGALFRREREIPGPRLQVSSDAAVELGLLAGAPEELSVVALKRETIEIPPEPEDIPADATEVEVVATSGEISETPLDPIAGAAAAIEAADVSTPEIETASEASQQTSSLTKPYVQVGIFNVMENADRTAEQMQAAGLNASVREGSKDDKTFWRVVAGPVQTRAERRALMKQAREMGFSDAFIVKN